LAGILLIFKAKTVCKDVCDSNAYNNVNKHLNMALVRISDKQADTLHDKKERGESYADVLERVYGVEK